MHTDLKNIAEDLMGSINFHVSLDYDDGVKWLVRLPGYVKGQSSEVVQRRIRQSEYLTHQVLLSIGVPVPEAFDWNVGRLSKTNGELSTCSRQPELTRSDPRCSHLIAKRLSGKELDVHSGLAYGDWDEDETKSMIDSFTDITIRMSEKPFEAIGSLDVAADGSIMVGSDTAFAFYEGNKPVFGGPYANLQERYSFVLGMFCKSIKYGVLFRKFPTLAYLMFAETRRLVMNCKALKSNETEFFLGHPDPSGGNILFEGTSVTGYIDWEW